MVYLNGDAIAEPDNRGQRIIDDSFILCFNAHHESIEFTLPDKRFGQRWKLIVDTTEDTGYPLTAEIIDADGTIEVPARSTMLLKQIEPPVYDDADSGESSAEAAESTTADASAEETGVSTPTPRTPAVMNPPKHVDATPPPTKADMQQAAEPYVDEYSDDYSNDASGAVDDYS